MYDKKYAKIWISNYESGKDIYRVKYLEPYLKKTISLLKATSKILDIGCGWGTIVKFLKEKQIYSGRDRIREFFDYLNSTSRRKDLDLKFGKLPNKINAQNDFYDAVFCSLVLHTISNIKDSIKNIFSKAKIGGKVFIIDFNDSSEYLLREQTFEKKNKETKNFLKGIVILPSKLKVNAEIYLHKEKDLEKEIVKYGTFKKKQIGKIFVVYECEKNQSSF